MIGLKYLFSLVTLIKQSQFYEESTKEKIALLACCAPGPSCPGGRRVVPACPPDGWRAGNAHGEVFRGSSGSLRCAGRTSGTHKTHKGTFDPPAGSPTHCAGSV